MHAVSQGALGVEARRDDLEMIQMINMLNDEHTLLRCVAERTFLAKLEGGCSAPVGVFSQVTDKSIRVEGAVFDLEGTVKIEDKFEISFDDIAATLESYSCPILPTLNEEEKKAVLNIDGNKRHLASDADDGLIKKIKLAANEETPVPLKHYSFITDLKISDNKLIKAELCGLHLAQKLKEKGADVLINQCKAIIGNKMN